LSVRFVVDGMLGTLAKWLRILGYDALFDPGLDDNQLVRLTRAEGRVLLTRDRGLAQRRGVQHLLIISENLDEQIRQVLTELDATAFLSHSKGERASRCPVCNDLLQAIDLEAARALVPPYVAQTQQSFCQCPACRRIYWRGTHRQHMEEFLERIGRETVRNQEQ
jgi:uncharacterized protein with PIN domain